MRAFSWDRQMAASQKAGSRWRTAGVGWQFAKTEPRFSWLSDSGKARNIQLQPIIGGACLGVSAQGVVTKPLKFPAFSS